MPRNIERDKREADRRKNQLIEAGFRLFSQNGIETVSLQKVADAANVSPATMYKYFLTKEKLLIQVCKTGKASLPTLCPLFFILP